VDCGFYDALQGSGIDVALDCGSYNASQGSEIDVEPDYGSYHASQGSEIDVEPEYGSHHALQGSGIAGVASYCACDDYQDCLWPQQCRCVAQSHSPGPHHCRRVDAGWD